jgi:hypothetical protein
MRLTRTAKSLTVRKDLPGLMRYEIALARKVCKNRESKRASQRREVSVPNSSRISFVWSKVEGVSKNGSS